MWALKMGSRHFRLQFILCEMWGETESCKNVRSHFGTSYFYRLARCDVKTSFLREVPASESMFPHETFGATETETGVSALFQVL